MTTPRNILQTALREGRRTLFEHEAKALVHAVGIMVPRSAIAPADDLNAIITAAESLGFPLALKAVSPDILHKTEAGAVMLNITSSKGLSASIAAMKNMIAARAPGAAIRHFLLEKMMPQGLELLIGCMRDEQFGPSVAFGLGGVWVEALKDAVFGILPLDHEEMTAMIAETRAGMFLKGFRGSPPLDEEAVHLIITNLAQLMEDLPEIREIDLNPVRVYARGASALDVRIILQ